MPANRKFELSEITFRPVEIRIDRHTKFGAYSYHLNLLIYLLDFLVVPRAGIEPATLRFSVACSTN